jgi:hypothetical protein
MDKIRVNIVLGKKQVAELKKRALADDVSVSRIIRKLVEEYLKN